ncbi:hypothetical protein C8J56DRAFT_778167, partial [Mycena floridula]
PRKLSRDDIEFILDTIEARPDIYLDELKEELKLQGIEISLASLCRYLHCNGVSHKWLACIAKERDHVQCAEFRDAVRQYDPCQIVSIDESTLDVRNLTRNFGWAFCGKRPAVAAPYE